MQKVRAFRRRLSQASDNGEEGSAASTALASELGDNNHTHTAADMSPPALVSLDSSASDSVSVRAEKGAARVQVARRLYSSTLVLHTGEQVRWLRCVSSERRSELVEALYDAVLKETGAEMRVDREDMCEVLASNHSSTYARCIYCRHYFPNIELKRHATECFKEGNTDVRTPPPNGGRALGDCGGGGGGGRGSPDSTIVSKKSRRRKGRDDGATIAAAQAVAQPRGGAARSPSEDRPSPLRRFASGVANGLLRAMSNESLLFGPKK